MNSKVGEVNSFLTNLAQSVVNCSINKTLLQLLQITLPEDIFQNAPVEKIRFGLELDDEF